MMGLYQFGEGAIRLRRVNAIRRVRSEAAGPEAAVNVYFIGRDRVPFRGPEAEAILEFLRRLPVPIPDAPETAIGDCCLDDVPDRAEQGG